MAIIKFDPVRGFETIARRMNDIMSDFDKGMSLEFGGFAPRVDISEDEKKIYVQAELPGMNKDEVKVSINEDNVLIIKGEKKREVRTEDKSYLRVERNYGEFARSFLLPDNVNKQSIQAKYDNGVLDITLDKIEPEKPKEVEINIS